MFVETGEVQFIEASAPTVDDVYLTAEELAQRHRVDPATLANLRSRGDGLPFTKVTGRILYKIADVLAAEARGTKGFTMARLAEACTAAGLSPEQKDKLLSHLKAAMRS